MITLAVVTTFVVPSFRETFADFDTEIPALTVALLAASGPIAGLTLAAAALGLIALSIACRRKPGVVALASVLMLTLALLLGAVTALSLLLPMVRLTQSVM